MNYYFNGKPIRKSNALVRVIDAWNEHGHQQPGEYFHGAHEQSMAGYLARDVVEQNVPGLTMRHDYEEQR